MNTTIVPMQPQEPPPIFFAPHPASNILNSFFIFKKYYRELSGSWEILLDEILKPK